MNVKSYIEKKLKKGRLHFSLIDPDRSKTSLENLARTAKLIASCGTDAIMVGGSTNIDSRFLGDSVKVIKKSCGLPVILFPGGLNGITKYADAIFFMSLLNSRDPYWMAGAQARSAPLVKKLGIEPIPMAYLIVEPGMEAGRVGRAELIRRNETEKAVEYALAAQYFGMDFVYLEAGSGSPSSVPEKMVKAVKSAIEIPLIVGGGIRSAKTAQQLLEAGADIIVTGTAIESGFRMRPIIEAVKKFPKP